MMTKTTVFCVLVLFSSYIAHSEAIDFENFFGGRSLKNTSGIKEVHQQFKEILRISNESSGEAREEIHSSLAATDENILSFLLSNNTSTQSTLSPSSSITSLSSSIESSSPPVYTVHPMETSTKLNKTVSNKTILNSNDKTHSSTEPSTTTNGITTSGMNSTNSLTTGTKPSELPVPSDDEKENVVLGTRQMTSPAPKTVIQKSIEWMGDTYTLSILIPIAAGVVFASAIIVTIAMCRCLKRRCRRRRLRRKALPDSVKNLRPSDHARLLAESSDDEF